MHVTIFLVCAALFTVVRTEETGYFGRKLEPVDVSADQETVSYLLPKLASKYMPSGQWSGVKDPRFYLLTEMESGNPDTQLQDDDRSKRAGLGAAPSLSIVNSLDVLRNRLLLEIARKKAMEGVSRNRQILASLGKRSMAKYRNV